MAAPRRARGAPRQLGRPSQLAGVHALERGKRCSNCGLELVYPNLVVQFVYNQCPLCKYGVPPPTPLGIPPPHPEIPVKRPHTLCMARVGHNGRAQHCERRRVGGGDYCSKHVQSIRRFGKLPYGRTDEAYREQHELTFPPDSAREQLRREQSFAALTYDEKVRQVQHEERVASSQHAHDTVLLQQARAAWRKRAARGVLNQAPLSATEMASILEPTYGIDLKAMGPGKMVWLKESLQAVMALPKEPLAVLAAVLGHPMDAAQTLDVTDALRHLVRKEGGRRLCISQYDDVLLLLARLGAQMKQGDEEAPDEDALRAAGTALDPCPGERKLLRVRYCLLGTVAELTIPVEGAGQGRQRLAQRLEVAVPQVKNDGTSRLTVMKAMYGHPHDFQRRFTVTEKVQGLVDNQGASRCLRLDAGVNLSEVFGEPCEGMTKTLELLYCIESATGDIVAPEAHGRFIRPVRARAPVVSPTMTVTLATLSPKTLVGRRFGAHGDAKTRLLNYKYFAQSSTRGKKTSIRCLDSETVIVTDAVRALIDYLGGDRLVIEKGHDVFHVLSRLRLGNVLRERFKGEELVLEIEYRAGSKLQSARLLTDKEHVLLEGMSVDARPVEAFIRVNAAVFGHPTDASMQANVLPVVEERVRKHAGRILRFDTSEDLIDLFGDPCFPVHVNKVLQVRYSIKEARGQLKAAAGLDGKLAQSIRVGWADSDADGV